MPTSNVSKTKKTLAQGTEDNSNKRVLRPRKEKIVTAKEDDMFDSTSVTVGGGKEPDGNSSTCEEPTPKKRRLKKNDSESEADYNFGSDSEIIQD